MNKSRSTEDKITVVPFDRNLELHERDFDLEDKLKAESEGILLWLIEGYQKWLKSDLRNIPEPVRAATEDYWLEADWLVAFVNDCIVVDRAATISNEELYTAYVAWTKNQDMMIYTHNALSKRLRKLNYKAEVRRDGGKSARVWQSIKLSEYAAHLSSPEVIQANELFEKFKL